ncbi:MAG: hypothetical protein WC764_02590 [Candidatus Paceibacterota bacterium]|jgi:Tfp pilus assembly protein PilE
MHERTTILEVIITVVTILIIAIIAPLIWRRYATESHDIRRVGAATELQRSLKNYFLSHSTYPIVTPKENVTAGSNVITALTNDFFLIRTHPPIDPESPKYDITYLSDGKTYEITFCQLEFVQKGYSLGCENKLYPLSI